MPVFWFVACPFLTLFVLCILAMCKVSADSDRRANEMWLQRLRERGL